MLARRCRGGLEQTLLLELGDREHSRLSHPQKALKRAYAASFVFGAAEFQSSSDR
jgi:hypothetical protein